MSDWDQIHLDAIEDAQAAEDAARSAPVEVLDVEYDEDGRWECPECCNEGTWRGCALCGAINDED